MTSLLLGGRIYPSPTRPWYSPTERDILCAAVALSVASPLQRRDFDARIEEMKGRGQNLQWHAAGVTYWESGESRSITQRGVFPPNYHTWSTGVIVSSLPLVASLWSTYEEYQRNPPSASYFAGSVVAALARALASAPPSATAAVTSAHEAAKQWFELTGGPTTSSRAGNAATFAAFANTKSLIAAALSTLENEAVGAASEYRREAAAAVEVEQAWVAAIRAAERVASMDLLRLEVVGSNGGVYGF